MSRKQKDAASRSGQGSAMETAAKYLASRMRTIYEVEKHLQAKGYDSEEITGTVNDLIGMRYLDDYQYALRYYEYNREKHRGSGRAARELAEKGVDAETIRYAREDFLYSNHVDEYADALEVAEKEVGLIARDRLSGPDEEEEPGTVVDDRLAAKIARKLDSKGFDRGDIFRVLDELRRKY